MADPVIVEANRGLSSNEARAPVRRFLSAAASSFSFLVLKEMQR